MAFSLWSYAYVTLEDVRAHVGGNVSDTNTASGFWGDVVNTACQVVESYLDRQIVARAVAEYRDAAGGMYLYPRHPPVATLTFYVDSSRQWGSETLLQATSPIATDDAYYYDAVEGCIKLLGWALPGTPSRPIPAAIKLAYTGGWAYTTSGAWPNLTVTADSIPQAIREGTLLVIQNLHSMEGRGKGLLGVASMSGFQAGSVAMTGSVMAKELVSLIPQQARQMLAPYKHRWGG